MKVRLNKQGAIRGARDVGIEIERCTDDYADVPPPPMADVFVAAGSNVEPELNLCRHCRRSKGAMDRCASRPPIATRRSVSRARISSISWSASAPTCRSRRCANASPGDRSPVWPAAGCAEVGAARDGPRHPVCMASLVNAEPGLIVPRPDLLRRPYMLKPMADIAPDLRASRRCGQDDARALGRFDDGSRSR